MAYVSQGEAGHLVSGKCAVNNQSDAFSVESILSRIEDRSAIKIKRLITYRDAEKAGLKPAFFEFNRKINSSHVQKLLKSLGNTDIFTMSGYVVPVVQILKETPDIKVRDIIGKLITLETPDVDRYYVVYDGQHRIEACIQFGKNVRLEFNDFDGVAPLQRIKEINTTQKGWVGNDYRDSNIVVGKGDVMYYEKSAELQNLYGITTTVADTILTFTKNAFRLKDIIEGKVTTEYIEENVQRGIGIFGAVMMSSECAKEMKKREFIHTIIDVYNSEPDSKKPNFAPNMKCYIGSMSNDSVREIKEFVSNKNFGELRNYISEGYKTFCTGHTKDELIEMEANVDNQIQTYIVNLQKTNDEKAAKKSLKSGCVHEILQHNENVEKKGNKGSKKTNVNNASSSSNVENTVIKNPTRKVVTTAENANDENFKNVNDVSMDIDEEYGNVE